MSGHPRAVADAIVLDAGTYVSDSGNVAKDMLLGDVPAAAAVANAADVLAGELDGRLIAQWQAIRP